MDTDTANESRAAELDAIKDMVGDLITDAVERASSGVAERLEARLQTSVSEVTKGAAEKTTWTQKEVLAFGKKNPKAFREELSPKLWSGEYKLVQEAE